MAYHRHLFRACGKHEAKIRGQHGFCLPAQASFYAQEVRWGIRLSRSGVDLISSCMGNQDKEADGSRDDETEKERLDKNLEQLLQELRVALPGVQVLFAFLLTVPFSQAFPTLTSFERNGYFFVLIATAVATALLIAPTAIHRVLFREGMKREIVMRSNTLSLIGLGVLAVAMTSAIALIAHIVFGETQAIISAICFAILFAGLWAALPLGDQKFRDWDDDKGNDR